MKQLRGLALLCAAIASLMLTAEPLRAEAILEAVQGSPDAIGENFAIGQRVYKQTCAGCHDSGLSRAPQPPVLSNMKPQTIYRAITEGAMKPMAASLTDKERVAVAEFLSHRKLTDAGSTGPTHMCNARHAAFDRKAPPTHAGWGYDMANSHAVSAKAAGFTRADLGKFKLKWAYGFADASRARSQPSLAGGAIFTGSHNGDVLALDRATGCERWRYQARAEVRTSVLVESWTSGDSSAEPLAFFGDLAGRLRVVGGLGALACDLDDRGGHLFDGGADLRDLLVLLADPLRHFFAAGGDLGRGAGDLARRRADLADHAVDLLHEGVEPFAQFAQLVLALLVDALGQVALTLGDVLEARHHQVDGP